MKCWAALFLSLVAGGGLSRGEGNFDGLASVGYGVRQKAQKTFLDWIVREPTRARDEILRVYLFAEDPELRMRLIPLLERAYFPPKGYVGIIMEPSLPGDLGAGKGIVVKHVVPGSPAERSGLREHDVIVQMDQWMVAGEGDLTRLFADRIQAKPPGKEVRLEVLRSREKVEISLQLGILPTPSEQARTTREIQKAGQPGVRNSLSIKLTDEMSEFQFWLGEEIEKHGKSHR